MGQKKRRKNSAPKAPAPASKTRVPLFALPRCPACGRVLPYRRCVARLPLFSVSCRCGAKFRCRPGFVSLGLWLLTVLLCLGLIRLVISVSTDMIPVYFFTAVLVVAAFFLHPLTLRACRFKPKKTKNEEDVVHLPEKYEK